MSTGRDYVPAEPLRVVNVESPATGLGIEREQIMRWVEAGLLPAYRVPPPRVEDEGDELAGSFWALVADVEALRTGSQLNPPPERDDDLRRVYVVELEGCEVGSHRGGPCVYVGQSVRSARARFIQHLVGYKDGRGHVRKWGTRLRPDLYADVPATPDSHEILMREREVAERLRAEGYNVHGVDLSS